MKLWFETHSTSVDNERGVASGHLDVPLSETGRAQAAELGPRYEHLAALYTSDLRRAIETAEIAFAARQVAKVQDPRLRECDYGSWSGCPLKRLEAARAEFVDKPFPDGGESFRDVVRRIENFLGDLSRNQEPVLIIGHRAPWYALEHLVRGRDLVEVVTARWSWQPGWQYEL